MRVGGCPSIGLVDEYDALGKETLALVQQLSEKRAARMPMPVGLCKRISIQLIQFNGQLNCQLNC